MDEAFVCRVFSKSIRNLGGDVWKIADPNGNFMQATKRPFDGFGFVEIGNVFCPLYWEAKCLKKLEAFNIKHSLRPHQAENLDLCLKISNSLVWVPLGINVGRRDKRLYIFDWKVLRELYYTKTEKNSISANILKTLPFMKIVKEDCVLDLSKTISSL